MIKFLLGAFFSFCVLGSSFPTLNADELQRVILRGKNAEVDALIYKKHGFLVKKFRHHDGAVAYIPQSQLEKPSPQISPTPVKIETDAPAFMIEGFRNFKYHDRRFDLKREIAPWGIQAIRADRAWRYTRGKGALVCVVDTGIDATHPDLRKNVVGGENFSEDYDGVIRHDETSWYDENGHGTHVAGIIAARRNGFGIVGIAPEAKLYSVRVLNAEGVGYISDVAEGIVACVHRHVSVINLSFGATDDYPIIREAIRYATKKHIPIVAAAGNMIGEILYPAKYPEVVAVSAVDRNLKFASFSGEGKKMDFTAPGDEIYSTYLYDSYESLSGTSMAAPHVTGVLALVRSIRKHHALGRFIRHMPRTQQGHGLIDALRSVRGF